jgi:hypothetical protein
MTVSAVWYCSRIIFMKKCVYCQIVTLTLGANIANTQLSPESLYTNFLALRSVIDDSPGQQSQQPLCIGSFRIAQTSRRVTRRSISILRTPSYHQSRYPGTFVIAECDPRRAASTSCISRCPATASIAQHSRHLTTRCVSYPGTVAIARRSAVDAEISRCVVQRRAMNGPGDSRTERGLEFWL